MAGYGVASNPPYELCRIRRRIPDDGHRQDLEIRDARGGRGAARTEGRENRVKYRVVRLRHGPACPGHPRLTSSLHQERRGCPGQARA